MLEGRNSLLLAYNYSISMFNSDMRKEINDDADAVQLWFHTIINITVCKG